MITIPSTSKNFSQPDNSNNTGNFYSTYNIDLGENQGRIRVGKRMILNVNDSSSGCSNMTMPVAFKSFNSGSQLIYAVGGTRIFKNTGVSPSLAFIEDLPGDHTGDAPLTCATNVSDMEVFKQVLWVTTGETKVYYLNSSNAWANFTFTGTGTTDDVKMLCQYADRMYMTYGRNSIGSWSTANGSDFTTTLYSITLDSGSRENVITKILAASNRIWILTVNTTGGKGAIYDWDGETSKVDKKYVLESSGALSGCIKDDVPYVMDTEGNLLRWNGGTFVKVAGLNREHGKLLSNASIVTNNKFIHNNGMTVSQGKIKALIRNTNNDSTSSVEETIHSGIWSFDPLNPSQGLIHEGSLGMSTSGGTVTDYGATRLSLTGALADMNTRDGTGNGIMLAGATYFTDSINIKYGIFYDDTDDTLQKAGYFVTPHIDAGSITDEWQKFYVVHRKFLDAADKITVKYRTEQAEPTYIVGTWASTTTFTTSTDLSAYWTSGTGGEVEVLQGVGAGKCSHITRIENQAGTYLVTVDETYTGATGATKMRIQSWVKVGSFTDSEEVSESSIGKASTWIQLKVWLLFTGKNEITKNILINKPFRKLE